MSKCNVNIDFNSSAEQLADQAKAAIIGAGGSFEGNAFSGNFSIPTPLGKVTGSYTIMGQKISIDIMDKPFLVSCNRIETELRNYLGA